MNLPEVFIGLGWTHINLVHEKSEETLKTVKSLAKYDISMKICHIDNVKSNVPTAIFTENNFEMAREIIGSNPSERIILVTNK